MPLERAQRYASELPELQHRGVKLVSFIGGEPLLAPRQLRLLSGSAVNYGMQCSVVTACHWAGSRTSAQRTVTAFPDIAKWQLSTDVFHEDFVARENVLRASTAVLARGRQAVVRMAVTLPATGYATELYRWLRRKLPQEVAVFVQPVLQIGRGAALATNVETGEVPGWPCVPNGMVVRFDGTIAPCCAGLVDQRVEHPFEYASADDGLGKAHHAWCVDPLLQLIRAVGFAPLLQWAREICPDNPSFESVPRHPCECCVKLWKNRGLGLLLRERAERQGNRLKVAELTRHLFDEFFMLRATDPARVGPSS